MGPEAKIKQRIIAYLKKFPPEELFYWSQVAHPRMRKGLPDISVIYKGRYVGLEVKTEKNKPTLNQEVTMERIKQAGGVAEVVRSVAEVKAVLNALN